MKPSNANVRDVFLLEATGIVPQLEFRIIDRFRLNIQIR